MGWWSRKKKADVKIVEPPKPDPAVISALLWVRGESPAGFRRYMKHITAQVADSPYRYRSADRDEALKHFHSVADKVNNVNRYALDDESALHFAHITRTEIPTAVNQLATNSLAIEATIHVYAVENFRKALNYISTKLDGFPTTFKTAAPQNSYSREIEEFMELISRATRLAKTAEHQYVVERAITEDLPQMLGYIDMFNRADFRQRREAQDIFLKQLAQLRIPLERVVSGMTSDAIADMNTHLSYLEERNRIQIPERSTLTLDASATEKSYEELEAKAYYSEKMRRINPQTLKKVESTLKDLEDEVPW